jgi:hypothetical protein
MALEKLRIEIGGIRATDTKRAGAADAAPALLRGFCARSAGL